MLSRACALLLLAAPLAVAACSSSDSSQGGGPDASKLAPYTAKYCTGTLKTDQKLQTPMTWGGAWQGDGTLVAHAGAQFIVSAEFDQWLGYAMESDGTPVRISGDATKGLTKDVDFTSDCATDAKRTDAFSGHAVVLSPATLYANKELSGTPCTLDAGTELTNYSYAGSLSPSDPISISANEIKAKCGLDQAYAKTLVYGQLIAK